jgi:indole-3-glycerol phosphate synthase / phosphoribosylanthranilate isomerase
VLEEILAAKRAEVAARREARPRGFGGLAPSARSLEAALRRGRTAFVLECKRASPSAGPLRPTLDIAAAARAYAAHADAVSVLCDRTYFHGALEDLSVAAASAVDLPVLCKDFVLSPWQVDEARSYGAHAVLLMLAALDDAEYRACAARAAQLAMDVLTEVHDEAELARALALGARIIGINNRDLRTMAVDLGVTERLAPRVPRDRLVVCESGLATHADVRRLRPHADAFLVGSALMRAPDLGRATRELIYGVTKICGLTRPADAAAAERAGATHGGLVFAGGSPRRVSPEQALAVRAAADLAWVGVFVDQDPGEVAALAALLRLAAVQLHGGESAAYVAALRPLLPAGCEVWKAVQVQSPPPPLAATGADRLLLDSRPAAGRGGAGSPFDWALLAGYADLGACLVAGGLTPATAAAAADLGAFGLDVSAGVEERPGIKSEPLVAAFLAARRGRGRGETAA